MDSRGRILIVEDENDLRTALAQFLHRQGFSVETAADGPTALSTLERFEPDLVLTDVAVPGMNAVELIRKIQALVADLPCLVVTTNGGMDGAVAAMRQGAEAVLSKPLSLDVLVFVIERALERRRLRAEVGKLRSQLSQRRRVNNLIGASPALQSVIDAVFQVAASPAPVLITGESGTGKDLVAAALHAHSPRAEAPFIKLHCPSLAESMLEGELFGEGGALTDEASRGKGLLQRADGGTILLDEIGALTPSTQEKLVRFLRSHELQRAGGHEAGTVDSRIIATSSRDLVELVREGAFREDLFHRLSLISIEMPPLRARPSDIWLLAGHFLARFAERYGKDILGFSDEALERLVGYTWPGNVRELEDVIERAVVGARQNAILARDLGSMIGAPVAHEPGAPRIPGSTMADIERYAILTTLNHTGGSTSRAAAILGIAPRTIQYRLHDYQLHAIAAAPEGKTREQSPGYTVLEKAAVVRGR